MEMVSFRLEIKLCVGIVNMSFCCHGMDIMVKEPANHTANSLPANNQNRLYCNTSYLSVKFSKNENKRLMSQNAKATIKIC